MRMAESRPGSGMGTFWARAANKTPADISVRMRRRTIRIASWTSDRFCMPCWLYEQQRRFMFPGKIKPQRGRERGETQRVFNHGIHGKETKVHSGAAYTGPKPTVLTRGIANARRQSRNGNGNKNVNASKSVN